MCELRADADMTSAVIKRPPVINQAVLPVSIETTVAPEPPQVPDRPDLLNREAGHGHVPQASATAHSAVRDTPPGLRQQRHMTQQRDSVLNALTGGGRCSGTIWSRRRRKVWPNARATSQPATWRANPRQHRPLDAGGHLVRQMWARHPFSA